MSSNLVQVSPRGYVDFGLFFSALLQGCPSARSLLRYLLGHSLNAFFSPFLNSILFYTFISRFLRSLRDLPYNGGCGHLGLPSAPPSWGTMPSLMLCILQSCCNFLTQTRQHKALTRRHTRAHTFHFPPSPSSLYISLPQHQHTQIHTNTNTYGV